MDISHTFSSLAQGPWLDGAVLTMGDWVVLTGFVFVS